MRGGDGDAESDLRELRTLLKSARNDVRRYAAHVIRLEQELERERLKTREATGGLGTNVDDLEETLLADDAREDELGDVERQTETVQKALDQLLLKTTSDCAVCRRRRDRHAETEAADAADRLRSIKQLVSEQKQQIESLARENAKLRDTLERRPSHRDLARSQWQIDSLQSQLARLKEERRTGPDEETDVPVFDSAPLETLTDRISVDKLLSWLHVETKQVEHTGSRAHASQSRRRFLKEPVECYLVLDSAALEGSIASGSIVTENERMRKREQLSRRVGILCSEIVAACCHSVGVYEVAKLPRYVEATYQYAQLVPFLQDFVHKIDDFTQAAAVRIAKKPAVLKPTDRGFLDSLLSRVQDLVFEVRARREQMKPPGDRALAVMMQCMKLLRVNHISDVAPTIDKLLDTARGEKEFSREVRMMLGVDTSAPRRDVLAIIQQLMEQVGLRDPLPSPVRTPLSIISSPTQSQAEGRNRE